jgi:hypothetical protein
MPAGMPPPFLWTGSRTLVGPQDPSGRNPAHLPAPHRRGSGDLLAPWRGLGSLNPGRWSGGEKSTGGTGWRTGESRPGLNDVLTPDFGIVKV